MLTLPGITEYSRPRSPQPKCENQNQEISCRLRESVSEKVHRSASRLHLSCARGPPRGSNLGFNGAPGRL
eukprot:5740516-Prymnesium_polylepis.1